MLTTQITYFGKPCTVACDARCDKAWGLNGRPRVTFDPGEPDDYAFLADGELGSAPAETGTWEGGHGKPSEVPSRHNKWCVRECERSETFEPGETIVLRDLSKRLFNMPSLHPDAA